MRNENLIRKYLFFIALILSATLLYGGYQVRKEADRKNDYQKSVQEKAEKINKKITQEMVLRDSCSKQYAVRFLRACA